VWESFCETLRGCGRNGTLFVVVIMLVFAAAPFGWLGVGVLAVVVLALICRACLFIARTQGKFPKLGKLPPLSQNDLQAARSKLLRQSNRH